MWCGWRGSCAQEEGLTVRGGRELEGQELEEKGRGLITDDFLVLRHDGQLFESWSDECCVWVLLAWVFAEEER